MRSGVAGAGFGAAGIAAMVLMLLVGAPVSAQPTVFQFSTGNPDGTMAMASRPSAGANIEIEAADDFVLSGETSLSSASFTGLLTGGATPSNVQDVTVEIYRIFPTDSTNPPSGHVPTRVNSPSDTAFVSADAGAGKLSFTTTTLNANFTAANSVLNGIHPSPNQTTGGEGAITGTEVRFDVTFTPALELPADHYFFVPQVQLSTGQFYWLSAPHPVVSPGTPFSPDLQAWIRDENLDPDWLRVGTDIVGGTTPPTFNGTFSLAGSLVERPNPGSTSGSTPTAITVAPKFTG